MREIHPHGAHTATGRTPALIQKRFLDTIPEKTYPTAHQLPQRTPKAMPCEKCGLGKNPYPDRSALIFAPEQGSGEDGLLQVREIRGLHLKARMVTLSACNTGVGPVGQAGVANLVNAFIEAGADTVVSTLWELEDHTTEHLMAQFYSKLAVHNRKVEALRTAQLELLDRGLPPYYWASFQIVGDPNGTF